MNYNDSLTAKSQRFSALILTEEPYCLELLHSYNLKNAFHVRIEVFTQTGQPDIIKDIADIIGNDPLRLIPCTGSIVIEFDKLIVSVPQFHYPFTDSNRTQYFTLYGDMGRLLDLYYKFKEKFPIVREENVTWFYKNNNDISSRSTQFSHKYDIHDICFPWIKPNIAEFQKNYLESDANVLLLIGDPGSGKTSFIRDMIRRNKLSAAITYDNEVVGSDQFFASFIDSDYDVLIGEDADVILRDRSNGNTIMNKLLNASDGLIQTKKKIVLSGNLMHLDEIDPALIRPGRCFEALIFRELTESEAVKAAHQLDLPEPDGPRTLAQLFSHSPSTKPKSRMGFTG